MQANPPAASARQGPQPAEISLGSGISRPGTPWAAHCFSHARACWVVANESTLYGCFALILFSLFCLFCRQRFYRLGRSQHFLPGILAGEAEPHHPLLYCAQRLVHQRGAVCPCTHADLMVLPQGIRHPCRILPGQVQRYDGRAEVCIQITVKFQPRHIPQLLIKQLRPAPSRAGPSVPRLVPAATPHQKPDRPSPARSGCLLPAQ